MKVIHQNTGWVLGENILTATSFWHRLRGYMFFSNPKQNFDGLFFPNSCWVHNCFVRFPLDIVFISKEGLIIKVIRDFHPWRFSPIYLKAKHVLELPGGTLSDSIAIGDNLIMENSGKKYF